MLDLYWKFQALRETLRRKRSFVPVGSAFQLLQNALNIGVKLLVLLVEPPYPSA
jgi:hypothetical protein